MQIHFRFNVKPKRENNFKIWRQICLLRVFQVAGERRNDPPPEGRSVPSTVEKSSGAERNFLAHCL